MCVRMCMGPGAINQESKCPAFNVLKSACLGSMWYIPFLYYHEN